MLGLFSKLSSRGGIHTVRGLTRNASTLTYLETTASGNLTAAGISALVGAKQLGNPISVLFTGLGSDLAAENLKKSVKLVNLEKVYVAKDGRYDQNLSESLAPLITNLLKRDDNKFDNFVIGHSAVGKDILSRLSSSLEIETITDIVKIQDKSTFQRYMFSGKILATVKSIQPLNLLSVRSSIFSDIEKGQINALDIEEFLFEENEIEKNIKVVKEVLSSSEGQIDLQTAKVVVAGGRAFKDKETFEKLLNPLAVKLKAAIGATRAAVDNGFCDNSLQIGQTGKIVAPNLYLAMGISGAIQHLAGIKDSKMVISINNDPDAAMNKNADYWLEGDILEIVPQIIEKL